MALDAALPAVARPFALARGLTARVALTLIVVGSFTARLVASAAHPVPRYFPTNISTPRSPAPWEPGRPERARHLGELPGTARADPRRAVPRALLTRARIPTDAGRERAADVARRSPGLSARAPALTLGSVRAVLRRVRGRDPRPRLRVLHAGRSGGVSVRDGRARRRDRCADRPRGAHSCCSSRWRSWRRSRAFSTSSSPLHSSSPRSSSTAATR